MPSSEEEVHTEEEINNLNPQRDEEEKLKEEDYQLSMNDSDWFNKKSRIHVE